MKPFFMTATYLKPTIIGCSKSDFNRDRQSAYNLIFF